MSFQWSKIFVNFCEFLFPEFAARSNSTIRDYHRKASKPRTQQREQGASQAQTKRSGSP